VFPKIKRDGHTHTHYCLHASGEHAEEYVQKAIEEGFTVYSFTEHLPFSESFMQKFPYPEEVKKGLGFLNDDLDGYFREMLALKKKYKDKIQLLVGLEIDYLPGEHDFLRFMLKEYGPFLEDGLLSVHIIEGHKGSRCVDMTPADFTEGLLDYYSTYEKVQLAYYQTIKEALLVDLGPYKPKRISHFTLCHKFQHYFEQAGKVSNNIKKTVVDLLAYMKEHGYSLDVNMAGLFKEYCREPYPTPWIIQGARQLKIPLVYGSDAHAVEDVGRAYDYYLQLMNG
jgi:histidinol-phosphatase (PHP family)